MAADNNVGPERLAGPKHTPTIADNQPFNCPQVLTVHGNELRLFWAKTFSTHTIKVAQLTSW